MKIQLAKHVLFREIEREIAYFAALSHRQSWIELVESSYDTRKITDAFLFSTMDYADNIKERMKDLDGRVYLIKTITITYEWNE